MSPQVHVKWLSFTYFSGKRYDYDCIFCFLCQAIKIKRNSLMASGVVLGRVVVDKISDMLGKIS